MSDSRFARKARSSLYLEEDQPLLVLLRDMFLEAEAEYNVKELAPTLGVSVFTIYKILAAQVRLPAETLFAIMEFVHAKDPTDTRLLDFICEPSGFLPVPKLAGMDGEKVREILMKAINLTRGDGK